jgi:hypothetical protein
LAKKNRAARQEEPAIQTARSHFLTTRPNNACLHLVHPGIDYLQAAVRYLTTNYNYPRLAVGHILAETLLPVAPQQYPRQIGQLLTQHVKNHAPGPLLCTDIDLLFEPAFSLDPLGLLRQISRQTSLIVTWPGAFSDNVLAYAEPEHAHYGTWTSPDLCPYCIIAL